MRLTAVLLATALLSLALVTEAFDFYGECPDHCVQKQCHYEYGCFQCMQGYLAHFVDGNCARSKYGTCVITCPDGYQPDPTNEFCQVYEAEED
ncbi:PREDICTED: uncharacterized protein LOC109485532 [Branchiostoma belcheri]|uniref:Uncharacterized protein LOC109485532 n=1 Tax=Branchiostoma belcheri TaxID=7741 RepID=A0A6P5ANX8_BRABE|nr:PREDICTED: uncharacterized protein LOC109485532 [Branchiostoma belcheri]